MDSKLFDYKTELQANYRKRLETLKPLLLNYMERFLAGDNISEIYIREYALLLMYHQILKNPKDETIAMLMPIVDRFYKINKSNDLGQIELAFLVYRLLSYDYHSSKFLDDNESPKTHYGLYI